MSSARQSNASQCQHYHRLPDKDCSPLQPASNSSDRMMSPARTCISRPDQSSSRGLLASICVVCGALLVLLSAVGGKLLSSQDPKRQQQHKFDREEIAPSRKANKVLISGLIDPHNGDNGTDPAQTITEECAGQFDLPVLRGVDVVAYWTLPDGGEPVAGTPNLMATFGSYRFFFSSIENLRTFEKDPLKYLPAWGGFCSYGVANEPVWTNATLGPFGNPAKWEILGRSGEARLHIFRSAVPMGRFEEDVEGNLERGEAVWQDWFGADSSKNGLGPLNTACFCDDSVCDDQ